MMKVAAFCLALALPAQALAAACPHGQIRRIHLHVCVSRHSPLARGYIHPARYTALHRPHHIRRRHAHCDPLTQCGDPIEDRVKDAGNPPLPQTATPRDDATPEVPPLPDAFSRSVIRPAPHWRIP
jgi:hypothetical protein